MPPDTARPGGEGLPELLLYLHLVRPIVRPRRSPGRTVQPPISVFSLRLPWKDTSGCHGIEGWSGQEPQDFNVLPTAAKVKEPRETPRLPKAQGLQPLGFTEGDAREVATGLTPPGR
jgi:hypothetical protein